MKCGPSWVSKNVPKSTKERKYVEYHAFKATFSYSKSYSKPNVLKRHRIPSSDLPPHRKREGLRSERVEGSHGLQTQAPSLQRSGGTSVCRAPTDVCMHPLPKQTQYGEAAHGGCVSSVCFCLWRCLMRLERQMPPL